MGSSPRRVGTTRLWHPDRVPTDRDRPRRWWLAPTIGVVVLATAVASLVVRNIYQQPQQGPSSVVLPDSTTTVPASQQPGSRVVSLTQDVYSSYAGAAVQKLVQSIFDAINNRDYAQWHSNVTDARAAEEPEPTWLSEYSTTHDGSVLVYRIDSAPENGLRVMLGFTSVQAVSAAPPDFPHPCIRWMIVWPLSQQHGSWRLAVGPEASSPLRVAC